ncbi:HAD family hydrolase [Dactylosporangium sp. CA-233914]|uniref:HAD family hydrolase n=1 Tax=Dactylosporangium sp. CA-233914 TaxID=3239934 RepID=UPI003D91BF08
MSTRPSHQLRAVVFDVDGTLAETERDGHRRAFNLAFRDHGLPYEWGVSEYGRLLAITGGRRRLEAYLAGRGHTDAATLARSLHETKTTHFISWVHTGTLRARPGVHELMRDLRDREVAVAVATTGSRAWVTVLLKRLFQDIAFTAVVTADDVTRLKPDPEAYRQALAALGASPEEALAVEDSPPGLDAAVRAHLPCLVVTSAYHRGAQFPGAAAVLPSYQAMDLFDAAVPAYLRGGVTAEALRRLRAAARSR